MAAVNRHVRPAAGVTEIRVHGVGGTTPEALLEQTGVRQVAGDDRAGFYRGSVDESTRAVEAYSWGGLTSRSRSRALWVLLLPFSLINLAGWMIEPPHRSAQQTSPGDHRDPEEVPSHRDDRGTRWHEAVVQVIAVVTTSMYVMWAALVSMNTLAFQCGAIEECREGRWYVEFLGADYFAGEPGRRILAGSILPLALLGLFMWLGKVSRNRYDEYGEELRGQVCADSVARTRTSIGRTGFWFPGPWQKQTARLHFAVPLLIIAGLLGRAVGRFEQDLEVEVASAASGAFVFWVAVAITLAGLLALFWATLSSRPLLGDGVRWFAPFTAVVLWSAVALAGVAGWLTYQLTAPDEALVARPTGRAPLEPITDLWGFGWAPIMLLGIAVSLVGAFSLIQIVRWIEWRYLHLDQILTAAMLLMIVLWQHAVWAAIATAAIAVGVTVAQRWVGRSQPESSDSSGQPWRLAVLLGFVGGAMIIHRLTADLGPPFGEGWPRVTPIAFSALCLIALSWVQTTGRLNAEGRTPKAARVRLALVAVAVAVVGLVWWSSTPPGSNLWTYGGIALAWCMMAVVWMAQFEHTRWRWNGPGAVALLGLAILMGAFSGLMIWLVDLLDDEGETFVLRATEIYRWLTVAFVGMLLVAATGLAVWYAFVILGIGPPSREGTQLPASERFPVALRAIDVVLTVATMVLLSSFIALVIHLMDTHGSNLLAWIDDGPPETWGGIVAVASWVAVGFAIGAVLLVRHSLKDHAFRTKLGILWDVVSFWPRSFHPFAPPPYTSRAVLELQSRLAEVAADAEPVASAEPDPEGRSCGEAILSGHSQGSVLSVAVVATLRDDVRERVWIVTHGSPLGSLYRQFFPLYFPRSLFAYCAATGSSGRVAEGRWLNLWRRTDPIGGPCFDGGGWEEEEEAGSPPAWSQAALDPSGDDGLRLPDVELYDPVREPPSPYRLTPEVRGHSGYMADPAMRRALDVLAEHLAEKVARSGDCEPEPERVVPPYQHEGREVHRVGEAGPAVVLLHELAGLTEETFQLANFVASCGYQVHLPVLFGRAKQKGAVKGAIRLCLSREFAVLRSNRTSPISTWIRSLCGRIAEDTSGGPVGLVGMCASGGIVLSAVYDESVTAVVACQPALPLRPFVAGERKDNLGAATGDVEAARESGKPILMMRFDGDILCPAGRQTGWETYVGGDVVTYPQHTMFDHSLLTYSTHHAPAARERLIAFLDHHLLSPATAPSDLVWPPA